VRGVKMANLITLSRFLLLFLLVSLAYWASPNLQLVNAPLLLLIIALDGLDGWVARRRGETSVFGSIFDIAVDRIVENVLWIVMGDLGLIPMWVAIVFIVRGAIVDAIRYAAVSRGQSIFGGLRSAVARTIVAGRWMRGGYGAIKAMTFGWVLMLQPWPALFPEFWTVWYPMLHDITSGLILLCVAFCLIRGLPVVAEFIAEQKVFRAQVSTSGR
jgi:CDP-diacylglycerol---glycerol-3-phosphate 3-phosphatidyltransferase